MILDRAVCKDPFKSLPFSGVLRPNAERVGRCYLAYPGLQRPRWLLPVEPPLRRAGSNLFAAIGLKGLVVKRLIATGLRLGERVWLDLAPLEQELAQPLGASQVRLAFYVGTSGAYRKLTVQIMTAGGYVPAYAKIADDAPAQASLERENNALNRLSAAGALSGRVPRALAWFSWGGSQVLLVTAGAGQMGPTRLTATHTEFLQSLHRAFAADRVFEASAMWRRMTATAHRLGPRMGGEWAVRYQRALNELGDALGGVTLPLSIAHRDFAPWNTRLVPQGLFVFDWEMASEEMTPWYDLLHFHAIQAALAGKRFRAPSSRLHEGLEALWPGGMAHLPALWLAYLTDMSLYYTEARLRRPEAGDAQVWRWLGQHIDAYLAGNHVVA